MLAVETIREDRFPFLREREKSRVLRSGLLYLWDGVTHCTYYHSHLLSPTQYCVRHNESYTIHSAEIYIYISFHAFVSVGVPKKAKPM